MDYRKVTSNLSLEQLRKNVVVVQKSPFLLYLVQNSKLGRTEILTVCTAFGTINRD